MTAAVLQMPGRRSASISKPQKQGKARKAQLPAIAPRYQLVSDPDAFSKLDPTANTSVNVPRTRLPPRSRFGCWWVFIFHILLCWARWLTCGTQDLSGNSFLSRPKTLRSILTDLPADTQGQVGLPPHILAVSSMYSSSVLLSRCDEARPECTVRRTSFHALYNRCD